MNYECLRFRNSLIEQLKSYLAGDGNLWGRMASSHPDAQGVTKSFTMLAEHLKSLGITVNTVEDYINSASIDLLSNFEDNSKLF